MPVPHPEDHVMSMLRAMIALLLVLVSASLAGAVDLRLDPASQSLDPGQPGVISLMIDEDLPLRTAEITLQGDPAVITGMVCEPGALFQAVPCILWEESEELEPGTWHGFVVIIGSSCATAGAGELLRWEFTAGVEGYTVVTGVEAVLYAPDGTQLDEVSVTNTAAVIVGTPSATPDVPASLDLALYPNPFNPAVTVAIDSDRAGSGTLRVIDVRGRCTATIAVPDLVEGLTRLTWRGQDDAGRALPSGIYRFVLDVPGRAPVSVNGTLLR
jgi:hypothetical protein